MLLTRPLAILTIAAVAATGLLFLGLATFLTV